MQVLNSPYNVLPFYPSRSYQLHRISKAGAYVGAPNAVLPEGRIPYWHLGLNQLIPMPYTGQPVWGVYDTETDALVHTGATDNINVFNNGGNNNIFSYVSNTVIDGLCGKYYIVLNVEGTEYWSGIWQNTPFGDGKDWFRLNVRNARDAGEVLFSKGYEMQTYFKGYYDAPEIRRNPETLVNGRDRVFTSFESIKHRTVLRLQNVTPWMESFFSVLTGNKMDTVELTHVASGHVVTMTEIEMATELQAGTSPLKVMNLSFETANEVYRGHRDNLNVTVVRESVTG